MNSSTAIEVDRVSHRYGDRQALSEVSFEIQRGETVALLGPNGGGKTTLLKILATLLVPTEGTARVLGHDIRADTAAVRKSLGVVFQSPGLDPKLRVRENLAYQARVFAIPRREATGRIDAALAAVGVANRSRDFVEKLSGGLARRVDLARALLSRPPVLLLDEPTVGLDPAARREFWDVLAARKREHGATVLYTTHLTQEGEGADRVGLVDRGRLEAFDAPADLTGSIGGDVVTVRTPEPERLAEDIRARLDLPARALDGAVVLEDSRGAEIVARLAESFPGRLRSISVSRPTLEDVFLRRTGHAMSSGEEP